MGGGVELKLHMFFALMVDGTDISSSLSSCLTRSKDRIGSCVDRIASLEVSEKCKSLALYVSSLQTRDEPVSNLVTTLTELP